MAMKFLETASTKLERDDKEIDGLCERLKSLKSFRKALATGSAVTLDMTIPQPWNDYPVHYKVDVKVDTQHQIDALLAMIEVKKKELQTRLTALAKEHNVLHNPHIKEALAV